ncbi:MAG: HU family DNA-binding protein [Prevotellaceae bacterium]|nr:HU family DNA-binding protein [Prevotellaceae bacterium]
MALEFLIKYRVSNLVTSKGKTVYYAEPKSSHYVLPAMVIRRIVEATSLATGDVRNALISLAEVLADELSQGNTVDLGDLGTFRLEVRSRLEESAEAVTVEDTLKEPRIVYHPKHWLRKKAKTVRMSIDHSMVFPAGKAKKDEA